MTSQCAIHDLAFKTIEDKIDELKEGQAKSTDLLSQLVISAESIKRLHARQDQLQEHQDKTDAAIDEIRRTPWKVVASSVAIILVIITLIGGMYADIRTIEHDIANIKENVKITTKVFGG